MTRNDIIRMALKVIPQSVAFELKGHYEIERFAALVAAYERELCARLCEEHKALRLAEMIRSRGEKP